MDSRGGVVAPSHGALGRGVAGPSHWRCGWGRGGARLWCGAVGRGKVAAGAVCRNKAATALS